MDDDHQTHRDRELHVHLDLQIDRQPITGRLRDEQGADEWFVGWLGFVAALERLQSRAPKETSS